MSDENQDQNGPEENPETDENTADAESSSAPERKLSKKELKQFQQDVLEFQNILVTTGQLRSDQIETLSQEDKEKMMEGFAAWIKAGKPKPEFPKAAKKTLTVIEKVYRARDKGEEFLYFIKQGSSEPVGIEKIPIYRKVERDGQMVDDKSLQTGIIQRYTHRYSEADAEKLVRKALRDTSNPKLYLVEGIADSKVKIRIREPDNFYRDFDELMTLVRSGKPI